ncbi:MAG: hypothetical protein IPL46_16990 [Saprospiraceae bacterium]|nr:hypothetical protein [Saprospiraceae bacterium]
MKTSYLLIIFFTIVVHQANAAIKYGNGIGDWDDVNYWTPVGLPTSADSILLDAGDSVTIKPGVSARAAFVEVGIDAILHLGRNPMNGAQGSLSITDAVGLSIINRGSLIIRGILEIKNSELTALLNEGSVTISLNGVLNVLTTGFGLGIDNLGSFSNKGHIWIDKVNNVAIENDDNATGNAEYFYNEGTIELTRIDSRAIYNGGHFENHHRISIDSTESEGLYNANTFVNTDTIQIARTYREPLINSDSFLNALSGIVHITESKNAGYPALTNRAFILNQGSINIENGLSEGLYNDGKIDNHGMLTISVMKSGLENLDTIYNRLGGYMMISDVPSSTGIENRSFSTPGYFENNGTIEIKETKAGIENYATLINKSTIIIDSVSSYGFRTWSSGQFVNDTMAEIHILHCLYGFTNTGSTVQNHGLIQTNHCLIGVINGGELDNHSNFNVEECENGWSNNYGILRNYPSGFINIAEISATDGYGFLNSGTGGSTTIQGGLMVSNCTNNGIINSAIFEVLIGGNIETINIMGTHFESNLNTEATFLGEGTIDIQN